MSDLSEKQLVRLWRRLMDRLPKGGDCYGWDWPTLAVINPGTYNALKTIQAEIRRRQS